MHLDCAKNHQQNYDDHHSFTSQLFKLFHSIHLYVVYLHTNNVHGWRHVILCWNQSVFFSTKQARRQRKTKRNNEQDFVFLDHIQLTLNIVSNGMEKMAYNNPLEKLLKYGQKHTWPTKYFHPIVYNAMCWDRMG